MSQNPLSLFFAEGFNCSVGVHGLMLIWVLSWNMVDAVNVANKQTAD